MSETRYVLDASTLLAAMLDEPGARMVAARIADAAMSTVNLSEVIAKLAERGASMPAIIESLAELDLDLRPFDEAQAMRAGALRQAARAHGLSLGDRACLALAAELVAVALTTNLAWDRIDCGVAIEPAR